MKVLSNITDDKDVTNKEYVDAGGKGYLHGYAVRADDVSSLAHSLAVTQYGQCTQDGTPTPAVPVAITGKAAGVSVHGKNLYHGFTQMYGQGVSFEELASGYRMNITCVYAANKYSWGYLGKTSSSWAYYDYTNLPHGNYTVSFDFSVYRQNTPDDNLPFVRILTRGSSPSPALTSLGVGRKTFSFIVDDTFEGIMLNLNLYQLDGQITAVVGDYAEVTNVQLELGSTATAYEPYAAPVTQTVTDAGGDPVMLYGIPVESGGNVTISGQQYIADTLENNVVTRRVGVKVFDGTETARTLNWEPVTNTYAVLYPYEISNNTFVEFTSEPYALCTSFIGKKYNDIGDGECGFTLYKNDYCGIVLRVPSTVATDYPSLQAWFASQYTANTPVTIYYVLATPTTESITLSPTVLSAISPTTTFVADAYSDVIYNKKIVDTFIDTEVISSAFINATSEQKQTLRDNIGAGTSNFSGDYNDLINKPEISTSLRESVSVSANGTSVIDIPLSISSADSLAVYQNGLLLVPTTHYTATTSAITLVGYTANAGDIFTFVSNNAEAGVSMNSLASRVLFSDTTPTSSYGGCSTVQDALVHAAEWQPTITSITLNGTEVSPSGGVVALTGLATQSYVTSTINTAIDNAITTALAGDY